MTTEVQAFAQVMRRLRDRPVAFNKHVLGRVHDSLPGGYWSKQIEVLESTLKFRKSVVPAGHGCGKSFLAAGAALHFAYTRPNSRVILVAPSWSSLKDVLWAELVAAWKNARLPLPGKLLSSQGQLQLSITEKWGIWGASADCKSPESLAGRHAGEMLVICDEASWDGYDQVIETLESFNASNYLFIGNPLRHGRFKELCDQADGVSINKIHISSLDSPHAHLDRSPVGLADKGYIEDMKQYGADHPVYRARVLGLFNDDDSHVLIPSSWLDRCDFALPDDWDRREHGQRVMSVDLSGGVGGDDTVIAVRDDDQMIEMDWSKSWGYPVEVTERVKALATKYRVHPTNIIYDMAGLGTGYGAYLHTQGISNAYGYVGSERGNKYAINLRGCSALALRDRLDPNLTPNRPFHIPKRYLDIIRPQAAELRYELVGRDQIRLEDKQSMAKRLRRSPDQLDALIMSFK